MASNSGCTEVLVDGAPTPYFLRKPRESVIGAMLSRACPGEVATGSPKRTCANTLRETARYRVGRLRAKPIPSMIGLPIAAPPIVTRADHVGAVEHAAERERAPGVAARRARRLCGRRENRRCDAPSGLPHGGADRGGDLRHEGRP